MNKNNRKDLLYRESFKLFLTKQFDGVSLNDIEKATGMTRGAIFYYHKDKLDLFKGVVKHYFIDKQFNQLLINSEDLSLKEFIDRYVDTIAAQMKSFSSLISEIGETSASKVYIIMGLKLRDYSEELNNDYTIIRNRVLGNWVSAFQRAVFKGEIQSHTDIITMAEIFVAVYLGQSIWESFSSGLDPEHLRQKYHYLYSLIKK